MRLTPYDARAHTHAHTTHTHTHIHTHTLGRTHLGEGSDHLRDLYVITHSKHERRIWVPPEGLEPAITAGKRPQAYALARVDTEIENVHIIKKKSGV